jgi:hypothetical protein
MNRASAEYEAADVAGDSVGGEMNEELRKVIRALSEAAFQTGRWRLSPIAPTDADILAAEAAVVAIFERERAVAKQLAGALREEMEDSGCTGCTAPVAAYKGCLDHCLELSAATRHALAAYEALEAKG